MLKIYHIIHFSFYHRPSLQEARFEMLATFDAGIIGNLYSEGNAISEDPKSNKIQNFSREAPPSSSDYSKSSNFIRYW